MSNQKSNEYYNRSKSFPPRHKAIGPDVQFEHDATQAAFDKLPRPASDPELGKGFAEPICAGKGSKPGHVALREEVEGASADVLEKAEAMNEDALNRTEIMNINMATQFIRTQQILLNGASRNGK